MREIVHIQAGQCGNQIGSKVRLKEFSVALRPVHLFSEGFLRINDFNNNLLYLVVEGCYINSILPFYYSISRVVIGTYTPL